jgi:hypothetical protein
MSDLWEAYGSLEFPNRSSVESWFASAVDDAARKVVVKLARGEGTSDPIEEVMRAYRASRTDLVECIASELTVRVTYCFDSELNIEHGSTLFGAIAAAARFGARGDLYVEDNRHPAYVLTLDGAKAKVAKWTKAMSPPADLVSAHRRRVDAWSEA